MGALDWLFGSSDEMSQQETLTPEQQQALKDYFAHGIGQSPLYQSGAGFLQNLLSGGPNAFAQFEAPYMQNFQQNIAPGIAQRFAGMGTGAGAMSSSGLNNALAQAGSGLQSQLAALRGGLQMQALPQALGYAQQPYSNTLGGLGVRAFENVYQPGSPGLLGSLLPGLGTGFGMGFGSKVGNRMFNPGGFG